MARRLRSGYTTGACAAAAALGAARMLSEQRSLDAVTLELPAGESATFALLGQTFADIAAHCFVIKDAGDDPDITNGVEVHAEVVLNPPRPPFNKEGGGEISIVGGTGIGRVTKPGLAVPVGDWAINPVPRQMITAAIQSVFANRPIQVTLSIPDGEERAKKTLNARLGIVGGLSLLGTTGIVRPLSHQAWTDTLEVALDVAAAVGCDCPVFATGRSSEAAAQGFLNFREEAYVMMGDHVRYAVQAARRKGFKRIVLAAQFAKLVKIACGHPQTHVDSSRLDLAEMAGWVGGEEHAFIRTANTAREVFQTVGPDHRLVAATAQRALAQLRDWSKNLATGIILVDYDKQVAGTFGDLPPQRNG
ncbi:MAG: cobalt-precorrin-5B (C(1))-methyltransferase CbiD [Desulfuromonadales bacterium]|nr:cobalt-precorrin-5B (C(1))-methyltransferase CbiD [Desulfuromonadales bacterium]